MSYEIMTESYNFVKCYGKDEIFIEIESFESTMSGLFLIIETLGELLVISLFSSSFLCYNGGILKFVLKRELHEKEGFYLLC